MERQDNATNSVNLTHVLLTLSGLASTCTEPLPPESAEDQTARIEKGIKEQLANQSLATAGKWELHKVVMSSDKAYLAYIAKNKETPEVAAVFRGTVFSNQTDVDNDDDFGTLEDFTGGPYGKVSRGFHAAFKALKDGTKIESELESILTPESILYVTGHSLGGALTTMFSLYLRDKFKSVRSLQAYTFAAPSAGDKKFADSFDKLQPPPVCVWNKYDVVPNSFAQGTLRTVQEQFFPDPGPAPTDATRGYVLAKILKAKDQYTQTKQQPPLNTHFESRDPDNAGKSGFSAWTAEMAFQHQVNTYLGLLGLSGNQLVPEKPWVDKLEPNQARAGQTVTISGKNFTKDCTVSFYISDKPVPASEVVVQGTDRITCTVPSGHGVADVRVIRGLEASAMLGKAFSYL